MLFLNVRDPELIQAVRELVTMVRVVGVKGDKIMAALDDLKAAVNNLAVAAQNEIKAIGDKLTSLGDSVNSADVEAAVAQINSVADSLVAETNALNAPPPSNG